MKNDRQVLRGQQMKSNEALLTIRQNLINAFKQYEVIIIPILRFILSLSALYLLKGVTNYTGVLSGIMVLIGFALIGSFASADCIVVLSILLTTLFVGALNPVLALMLFGILSLIYLLYAKVFPKESLLIIVMLIAFFLKIELLVPIVAALFGTYMSIIAIILGVMIWFTMPALQNLLPAATINKDEILDTLSGLVSVEYKGFLVDSEMMVTVVVFLIVFSSIYLIRKQSIDYGPYVAIGVGAVMTILGFGLAIIFLNHIEVNILLVILKTIGFSFIAAVLQFMSAVLDYQRAETVSFEDDDNYYFVKIVPKIQLTRKHKVIKRVYTDLPQDNEFNHMRMDDDDINLNL